jgi:dienelactone hydrolase
MSAVDNLGFVSRIGRVIACCVLLISTVVSHAESVKPMVETFFSNSDLAQVSLSPDGKLLAMLVATKERVQLAVLEIESNSLKIIAGYSNVDIAKFHWVNNQRIVYSTGDRQLTADENRFFHGLFAVNRDGTESRILVNRAWGPESTTGTTIKKRVLPANTYFHDVDRSNLTDDIFVVQSEWDAFYDFKAWKLLRLNTKTGIFDSFDRPGNTIDWLIDQAGVPRVNVTLQDGVNVVHYRDSANDSWRKLAEFKEYQDQGFEPYAFGPDGTLYVVASIGRDTKALYRYDLKKNAIDPEPLVSVAGYDFDGSMVFDDAKKSLLGIQYKNDATATLWFDERIKKIQQVIDGLLPSTINKLSFGRSMQTRNVLIEAYSDTQPDSYFLYDTGTAKLISVGGAHPNIAANEMAMQDMVRYKARDGLEIPAYLTLPNGASKKNLPMVVLVHGGPYVRGASWGWDPQVQFLASRGYAVLQPEFRGSTGFGFKHFQAGWKQWGLAMQDDIADGAKWAIAQGIADPKRICIAGASYGGYATLMGLANNPELFKCGVNWVGVTDISLMYKSSWSNDLSAQWQRFGMPVMVGDPVNDAAQIKATSPVTVADRITQPLLMAYGRADRRVPIEHGISFRDAVSAHNKKVEWIEYLEEGHGWALVKNRVDFWTHVEKFLDRNIGSARQ